MSPRVLPGAAVVAAAAAGDDVLSSYIGIIPPSGEQASEQASDRRQLQCCCCRRGFLLNAVDHVDTASPPLLQRQKHSNASLSLQSSLRFGVTTCVNSAKFVVI